MLRNEIISLGAILLALLILMVLFSRDERPRQAKINITLAANIFFVTGSFTYPFHPYPDLLLMGLAFLVLDICCINKIRLTITPGQQQYLAWQSDPANWRMGMFYFNRKDPRIFPMNKKNYALTINFGNPMALLATMAFIVILFVLMNAIMMK